MRDDFNRLNLLHENKPIISVFYFFREFQLHFVKHYYEDLF